MSQASGGILGGGLQWGSRASGLRGPRGAPTGPLTQREGRTLTHKAGLAKGGRRGMASGD